MYYNYKFRFYAAFPTLNVCCAKRATRAAQSNYNFDTGIATGKNFVCRPVAITSPSSFFNTHSIHAKVFPTLSTSHVINTREPVGAGAQ